MLPKGSTPLQMISTKRNRSEHFELLMKSSETLNHLSLLQLSNLLPLSLLLLHFVLICPSLCSASLISRFNLWSFPLLTSLCPFYRFAIGKNIFLCFSSAFFLTDHQFLLFLCRFYGTYSPVLSQSFKKDKIPSVIHPPSLKLN